MTCKQKRGRRARLLQLYGRHCWLCHKDIPLEQVLTIDHVVPIALGGGHDIDNLRLAHKQCNNRRGHNPDPVLVLRKDMMVAA